MVAVFSSSNGHSLVSDKERDGAGEIVDQIARPTGRQDNSTDGIDEIVDRIAEEKWAGLMKWQLQLKVTVSSSNDG